MEHSNILLNSLVILAMVIIATPNDADGYKILNYDEDSPTYPWERIVYRGNMPRIQKKSEDEDTEVNGNSDIPGEGERKLSSKMYQQGNKRINGFDENMSGLNNYGKARVSVIYGRVSLPVMVVSSYPEPKQ